MSDKPTLPTRLVLYSYFRSSASARVRTVMALHRIPHETEYIHLLKGEQKTDTFKAINPAAAVPALVITERPTSSTPTSPTTGGGGETWTLTQSPAIMEYLDETYGHLSQSTTGPLLPPHARERAQVRRIVAAFTGDVFPCLTNATLGRVRSVGGDAEGWTAKCIEVTVGPLEKIISSTSDTGKYCVGDRLTLADVALATQMNTVLRYHPDISAYPTIKSIYEHVSNLPQFLEADFRHQPDTPEELRVK